MKITLTKEEQKKWELANDKGLENKTSEKQKAEVLISREELMESLRDRKVIPEIRLKYYFLPQYNLKNTKKARSANFENFQHPYREISFLKYLTYFIEGPSIPEELLNNINEIRAKYPYTGDSLDEVKKAVRNYLKNDPANKSILAEELYKLYLEFDDSDAELIRKYTMNLPH